MLCTSIFIEFGCTFCFVDLPIEVQSITLNSLTSRCESNKLLVAKNTKTICIVFKITQAEDFNPRKTIFILGFWYFLRFDTTL